MNSPSGSNSEQLLIDIRDLLVQQVEGQKRSMALQQRQFEMVSEQFERAKSLQTRAESLHQRSQAMIETARKPLVICVPVVALLVGLAIWYLL